MANEILASYDTGETLYALVFNAAGQVWDQTLAGAAGAFTAYAAADIDQYDVPLAEIAANSTQYRGTFPPNIVTGVFSVVLYEQAGGAPVVADDERIGETATMYWNTTANLEIDLLSMNIIISAIQVDTDATIPTQITNVHGTTDALIAAVPTAAENRDAILDDATRFSGADMAELAAANIPADIDTLLTRLSAARAGYLDELAAANIPADIDTLLARLSAARAGYLDELAAANLPSDVDAILLDTGTTIPAYILSDVIGADGDTLETLSDQMDILGAGSGGTAETYTVTDDVTGFPIDGVHVWVSTDIGGANIIWAGYTNAAGQVNYYHDLATGTTVYLWRELAGYRFTNPDSEVTS